MVHIGGTKCTTTDSNGSTVVVPSLVQRLEWMLYNAAHSMHEYTHEQSLERRVQALVTQLEPKVTREGNSNSKRNRNSNNEGSDHGPDKKRQCFSTRSPTHRSVFLLDNDDNLVGLVLSFLSGRTVLRLRSVNKFLLENGPKMVTALHVETHAPALQHFSTGTLTRLLLSCSKLTSLVVTSKLRSHTEMVRKPSRVMVYRRLSFSRPLKNGLLAGELVLRDITRAFERGACPELQELDLGSPLDYFAESDDVLKCLEAFATGRRRSLGTQRIAAPLRYLRLDSTYLGDTRLNRVADWISCRVDDIKSPQNPRTQNGCCSSHKIIPKRKRSDTPAVKLRTLLLQDNFIGQEGLEALSTALNARLIPL
ncbi:uncharacterized protein PITG_14580 [Phytophthora infestans T30-4]|uniref:Uncharacterized protein n=1 Tax=Phytophthora infestans (strain T30-4) TaxID=403677 RepID=D0NQL2_PHYIT|nr:uncharacterized protein PITG_14580 [Phytophthora infestans T30-4]EEY62960.1 conserved hypothetical protein [Phytophthora infestans T30-4]|eukprot:XP_002898483.1 conserved hypothetical protein [Phytophthora infestans T30-4]